MKVLLFYGDCDHPTEVAKDGLEPLTTKGFAVDAMTDMSGFDPVVLSDYDVVVVSKADHVSQTDKTAWKTVAVQNAFVEFVERGGGLVVVHNGTVSGEGGATDVLDRLAGCRFSTHPNNCPVTVGMVKPHPVTDGVGIFCEVDEHYHLDILTNDVDILAASYAGSQGEESKYESEPYFNAPAFVAPAVYVRTQGKGRVCVITPGHVLEVWLNAEFQKLLENALTWCAGKA